MKPWWERTKRRLRRWTRQEPSVWDANLFWTKSPGDALNRAMFHAFRVAFHERLFDEEDFRWGDSARFQLKGDTHLRITYGDQILYEGDFSTNSTIEMDVLSPIWKPIPVKRRVR